MNNFGYQPSESNKGVKPNLPKTDSDTKKNQLDTYIDVLKEESVRLSNMIAKLNDKIQETEKLIKEQNEPKFELAQDEKYYFINFLLKGLCLTVQEDIYVNALRDRARVNQNNCFKTEKRAKEVLNKIELLLKQERLHDIYCPDYKPNWGSDSLKYYIDYDTSKEKWCSCYVRVMEDAIQVYFPAHEIAQKVCDILNREEQNNEIS